MFQDLQQVEVVAPQLDRLNLLAEAIGQALRLRLFKNRNQAKAIDHQQKRAPRAEVVARIRQQKAHRAATRKTILIKELRADS
jgi:hypothetical protein